MNLFEVPRFNWWKYMDRIMENVNLNDISMLQNNHMIFAFSSCYDGKFYKKLSCSQILKCCIQNEAFENEEFAYFIADIYLKELNPDEIVSSLEYYKYGYNINASKLEKLYLISIIGSEVSVEIICGQIEVE